MQERDHVSIQNFKFDAIFGLRIFLSIKIFTYRCIKSNISLLGMNLCFVQICNSRGIVMLKIWDLMGNKINKWKSLVKVALAST
jgi:hypothetical protein